MAHPIRIAIANDYEIIVQGLGEMLRPFAARVSITACASGTVPDGDCDIVLYDTFGAPLGAALDVAGTLRDFRARHLVIYTWDVDAVLDDDQLRDGMSAVVSKAVDGPGLVEALEQVGAGDAVIVRGDPAQAEPTGDWPGGPTV